MTNTNKTPTTSDYLQLIGVSELPPLTTPFDPGYDPCTLESHLDQSAHLMAGLKISMACWMIAKRFFVTRLDIRRWKVDTVSYP